MTLHLDQFALVLIFDEGHLRPDFMNHPPEQRPAIIRSNDKQLADGERYNAVKLIEKEGLNQLTPANSVGINNKPARKIIPRKHARLNTTYA